MNKLAKGIFVLGLLAALTSCYRMPTEDDYNINPLVNNPTITREKPSQQLMPSVGY
jgi:hypothetical protein